MTFDKVTLVECNRCGWHHVRVSLASARTAVNSFNEMFYKLSKADQNNLYSGRPAKLDSYLSCFYCGNSYKDFHLASPRNYKSLGHTMQPILDFLEEIKEEQ